MSFLFKSLQYKLGFLIGAGIIATAVATMIGFASAWSSFDDFEHLSEVEFGHERAVLNMTIDFKKQVQEWKNVLLRGHDAKQLDKYWGKFQKSEAAIQTHGKTLLEELSDEQARASLSQFLASHRSMGQAYREGLSKFKAADFDPKVGDRVVKGIDREPTQLLQDTAVLIADQAATAISSSIGAAHSGMRGSLIAIPLLMLGLFFGVGILIRQQILKPAFTLRDYLSSLASGDFSRDVGHHSQDEFGDIASSARHLRQQLGQMIGDIAGIATRIGDSSSQLEGLSTQNTEAVGRQRQQTELAATAMTQMNATVQEIAQSAESTAEQARQADELTKNGQQLVTDLASTVQELVNEVTHSSDVVRQVERDSEEIGKVLDVIRGIAEQTNLLALNAAIEAARAGEQGRGFAVVADEVRTLASRTQSSTEEIQDTIERLQDGTRVAARAMEQGSHKSSETGTKAEEAAVALAQIAGAVSGISEANLQIASAAEEQGTVSEDIDRNVTMLNDSALNIRQAIEKTDSTVTDMRNMSAALLEMTQGFRISS